MKPDWSSPNVPEWATFAAQEASGSWYFYEFRPVYSELCTEWQTKGRRQIIPKVELRPQATLEERPRACTHPPDCKFCAWCGYEAPFVYVATAEGNGCEPLFPRP